MHLGSQKYNIFNEIYPCKRSNSQLKVSNYRKTYFAMLLSEKSDILVFVSVESRQGILISYRFRDCYWKTRWNPSKKSGKVGGSEQCRDRASSTSLDKPSERSRWQRAEETMWKSYKKKIRGIFPGSGRKIVQVWEWRGGGGTGI